MDKRTSVFQYTLWTSTGIAYQKDFTKFKIVPLSVALVEMDFSERLYLEVNYDSVDGIELDRNQAKYGHSLTKGGVLEHPGWNALISSKPILTEFADIVFSLHQQRKDMGFYTHYCSILGKIDAHPGLTPLVYGLSDDAYFEYGAAAFFPLPASAQCLRIASK